VTDPRDTELSTDDCWALLARQELGRLAFRVLDEQHITPINYAVDVTGQRRPSLLFRTTRTATKLLSAELGGEVALEIDEIEEDTATSVVVRGFARRLDDEEAHRAENLPLRPWVGPEKHDVVEIVPSVVTGRRFHLSRPWRHLRPAPD
jgi:nitroimidazol reductase NimA-like FMN-containing flavoprotein (pyridoxamine 5'-phosphate oxidase superfamily)